MSNHGSASSHNGGYVALAARKRLMAPAGRRVASAPTYILTSVRCVHSEFWSRPIRCSPQRQGDGTQQLSQA